MASTIESEANETVETTAPSSQDPGRRSNSPCRFQTFLHTADTQEWRPGLSMQVLCRKMALVLLNTHSLRERLRHVCCITTG